ncbi:MAG: hypothetical protein IKN04_06005 [Clostridia bacterium]|nr:hypothetical protein [Clostridia bacterium]MBR6185761.1 hypothetical protein [Clostridia bacterium]
MPRLFTAASAVCVTGLFGYWLMDRLDRFLTGMIQTHVGIGYRMMKVTE